MMRPDPDPLPGDFDEELKYIDARDVQVVEPAGDRRHAMQVTVEGDDLDALQRIADARGELPDEVVRSLIRAASNHVA